MKARHSEAEAGLYEFGAKDTLHETVSNSPQDRIADTRHAELQVAFPHDLASDRWCQSNANQSPNI